MTFKFTPSHNIVRAADRRSVALWLIMALATIAVSTLGLGRADGAAPASIQARTPAASSAVVEDPMGLEAQGSSILTAVLAHFPHASASAMDADTSVPFQFAGTQTDQDLAVRCLSQAIYYEAASEPVEGRRAVAQVVLNRVRSAAYPNSVCAVVYQGVDTGTCQFSFACERGLRSAPASAAWHEAEMIARQALGGYVEEEVGSATHYHADYVAPAWAPTLRKVAVIGRHIFYEWPRAWAGNAGVPAVYSGELSDPQAVSYASAVALGRPLVATAAPRLDYDVKALLAEPAITAGSAETVSAPHQSMALENVSGTSAGASASEHSAM